MESSEFKLRTPPCDPSHIPWAGWQQHARVPESAQATSHWHGDTRANDAMCPEPTRCRRRQQLPHGDDATGTFGRQGTCEFHRPATHTSLPPREPPTHPPTHPPPTHPCPPPPHTHLPRLSKREGATGTFGRQGTCELDRPTAKYSLPPREPPTTHSPSPLTPPTSVQRQRGVAGTYYMTSSSRTTRPNCRRPD